MFGLDFSNPKLSPVQIAGALSESGICLLTGETTGLSYIPVDGDPRNALPSNVACVSTAVINQIICQVGYSQQFHDYQVTLETPLVFAEYNCDAIASAQPLDPSPPGLLVDDRLLQTFALLAKAHVKGIRAISTGGYTLSWKQFQNHLVSVSRRAVSKVSKLTIL